LYGCSMSEPLPVGQFRFLEQHEIDKFDVMSIPADAETGYILECELAYPKTLHQLHKKNWKPAQKLVPNLQDKTKYVCHYRNLQFYIRHGLVLNKIHRIIAFQQKRWLELWIGYCTRRRQMALDELE